MGTGGDMIDVAVPLPLVGPFTYRLPAELLGQADFGRRVLVPFRSKIRAGFIVGDGRSGFSAENAKEVIDIPVEPPYLTPELWHFIQWVAEYYLLPTGLVLKTALPPGSDRKSKPWAILTPEGRKWFGGMGSKEGLTLPPKFLRLGVMLLRELVGIIGQVQLDKARELAWIRIEERIARPRVTLRSKSLPELLDPVGTRSASMEAAPTPTQDQQQAIGRISEAIDNGGFHPFLLYGITGSGKTEIYLRAIDETLKRNKSVIVLVPEIALTPQLARRFLRRVPGGMALYHSGLTPAQRLDEWRRMRLGQVRVVIAARSGIFVPLENLGLIVVDEEHDPSYKQEDSCPYNARDMAVARGKLEGACVVLGSATPSFETFVNANRGKFTRLDLRSRYHGGDLPKVEMVDLRKPEVWPKKGTLLTLPMIHAVREALDRNEQVILFLNRRGFDTFAQCRSCGNVFKCPNCDISLTHHKRARDLRCHTCGFSQVAPPLCPQCSGSNLFFGGVGTQKVEEELASLFKDARIERLDRDSTRRRQELETILERFRRKDIDILTGTQMIVKGHDFPGISLVGVLCGDHSLHFPDFRATERTFQMITQVAGRTGRGTDPGKVLLQTFDPNHAAIRHAAQHAYEEFFAGDSEFRRELFYPPYGYLILIRVEGNNEARVEKQAVRISRAARLLKGNSRDVMILGPAPAPRRKVIGKFRWQVLFKSEARHPVRSLVRSLMEEGHLKAHGFRIIVDVDPVDMM